ncbi:MAG: hypothetical protein AAF497_01670 [Planctomycetota bacterium]
MTRKWKTIQTLRFLAWLLLAGVCLSNATASTWTEIGDAPDLPPGQVPSGTGALTQIDGNLQSIDFEADVFCIHIDDPANFSATELGAPNDIALWLFDANFDGVTFHGDDDSSFSPPTIVPGLTNAFVPGPGVHYLAVSPSGRDPVAFGLEIWQDLPLIERMPDGPGAPGPISGWTGLGFGQDRPYSIALTGTSFCVPEANSFGLFLSGLPMGLIWARRRLGCTSKS